MDLWNELKSIISDAHKRLNFSYVTCRGDMAEQTLQDLKDQGETPNFVFFIVADHENDT